MALDAAPGASQAAYPTPVLAPAPLQRPLVARLPGSRSAANLTALASAFHAARTRQAAPADVAAAAGARAAVYAPAPAAAAAQGMEPQLHQPVRRAYRTSSTASDTQYVSPSGQLTGSGPQGSGVQGSGAQGSGVQGSGVQGSGLYGTEAGLRPAGTLAAVDVGAVPHLPPPPLAAPGLARTGSVVVGSGGAAYDSGHLGGPADRSFARGSTGAVSSSAQPETTQQTLYAQGTLPPPLPYTYHPHWSSGGAGFARGSSSGAGTGALLGGGGAGPAAPGVGPPAGLAGPHSSSTGMGLQGLHLVAGYGSSSQTGGYVIGPSATATAGATASASREGDYYQAASHRSRVSHLCQLLSRGALRSGGASGSSSAANTVQASVGMFLGGWGAPGGPAGAAAGSTSSLASPVGQVAASGRGHASGACAVLAAACADAGEGLQPRPVAVRRSVPRQAQALYAARRSSSSHWL